MSDFAGMVLTPRAWAAAIASSFVCLAWLVAALTVGLLLDSPLTVAGDLLRILTSLSSLTFAFLFVALAFWSVLRHSSTFSTTPSVLKSWASLVHQVGSDPQKLASVVASSLLSAALSWCFLKISPNKFSSLFEACPTDSQVFI